MPVRKDPSDSDVWQAYAKRVQHSGSRKIFAEQKCFAKTAPSSSRPAIIASEPLAKQLPKHATAQEKRQNSFDRKFERQLRDGSVLIEARLDLHGMTQPQAHAALARFIATQRKMGHRRLLVITGKGRANQGALRLNLQTWLEQLPEAADILILRPAAPRHGGEGAFYVMMKKCKQINHLANDLL